MFPAYAIGRKESSWLRRTRIAPGPRLGQWLQAASPPDKVHGRASRAQPGGMLAEGLPSTSDNGGPGLSIHKNDPLALRPNRLMRRDAFRRP